MRQSIFDYVGNLDTLIAVVVGALLATSGALFAELIQDRLNRKRRERDAARFFGEILASIDRIIDFAFRSQTIGDEWGSVTQRLFRTAMREAGVYERNRERLFDLRNAELRSRIHTHFLSETFPIDAVLTSCEQIEELSNETQETPPSGRLKTRLEKLRLVRQRSLETLRREHAKTHEICAELEKIGGVKFSYVSSAAPITQQTQNATDNIIDDVEDCTGQTATRAPENTIS